MDSYAIEVYYEQWIKDNWDRIIEEFTKENWRKPNESDFPVKIEAFARELFEKENPEMVEEKKEITIRDRLKSYFRNVKN